MVWERGMGFEEIVPVFRYAVGYLAEEIDGGVWGAHFLLASWRRNRLC